MCPWAADAITYARPGSTPSLWVRTSVTAATDGVRSDRCRQRDLMVGSASSTEGAQSTQTVRAAGSSMAFSSTFAAASVRRSESSSTMTCQRRPTGDSAACRTSSRVSLTPIDSSSVAMNSTSGCEPANVVWHPAQWPQPGGPAVSHCRAAAKARAAVERPDPGGPVSSHAWVIPLAA